MDSITNRALKCLKGRYLRRYMSSLLGFQAELYGRSVHYRREWHTHLNATLDECVREQYR